MPGDLRSLLDLRELDDLVHTAVGALDAGDWDLYERCFAPDVEFSLPRHAASEGLAPEVVTGVEHFIPVLRAVLSGFDSVQHHLTNLVHRVAGDEASTSCYVVAEHVLGDVPGENSTSIGGRYAIAARRAGSRWSLTRWDFTPAWSRGNPGLFAAAAQRAAGNPWPGASSPAAAP